jgi:sugar-specific transcriptional regulator TrmB
MNIEKLKKLGLSPYEAKCYLALLIHGNLLGKEIAKHSGVPPTSVYRNLESLTKRGFIQIIQKDPFVYQAISPEIAISSHVKSQKEKLEELENNTIDELKSIKKQIVEKREEVLEVYSGRTQAYKIGNKLIKKSEKEMLLIGSGNKQSVIDIIHSLKDAVKRGVNCKFIATLYEDNVPLLLEMKKSGIKVKHYPIKNFSMLIKDRSESMTALKQVKNRVVLNVRDKDLSLAYAHYFDSIWRKSTPV